MAELTALQTGGSKASLHSIPLLPSAPLCVSFPQFMLETSPQLFGPTETGQPGKALGGETLSQAHGQGAESAKGQQKHGPKAQLQIPLALRKSLPITVPCSPHLWKDADSTDGHSREGQRGATLDPGREKTLVE